MQKKNPALTNKFAGQGFILFLDQISVAVTNWIFWIVISRLASTSEIGQATSVYSLVLFMSTVGQLGLEYPLLKKSSLDRSRVLGTALTIELLMISGLIPAIIFLANTDVYHGALAELLWPAVGILALSPLSFIGRFTLLGISSAKNVLIFETLATSAKFLVAYILVSEGFGAFGIVLSFMAAGLISASGMLMIAARRLSLRLVGDKREIIEVLKGGLSNFPSKLSRTMIITLSVILLASFGISDSDIGVFYIASMISLVGVSLATSLSFTVIPASAVSKADLSSGSLRIGLSLTAPIIAALIVAPGYILGIIGTEYAAGDAILLTLSAAIFSTIIVMNAISKFNNIGSGRKITVLGIIQIMAFLTSFLILVPYYGSLGAAFSILIAYSASAAFAVYRFERSERRSIAISLLAIIIGCGTGFAVNLLLDHQTVIGLVASFAVTSIIVLALKNISISELGRLLKTTNKPRMNRS
jgi:O-antigen/teichoic acid export membrane protein